MTTLFKRPKPPQPTAEQKALERSQLEAQNEETRKTNRRLKALARGRAGRNLLLSGSLKGVAGRNPAGSNRGQKALTRSGESLAGGRQTGPGLSIFGV